MERQNPGDISARGPAAISSAHEDEVFINERPGNLVKRQSWSESHQTSKDSKESKDSNHTSGAKSGSKDSAYYSTSSLNHSYCPSAADQYGLPIPGPPRPNTLYITLEECIEIFLPYSNYSIKSIKRIIPPNNWFIANKIKCAKIAQQNGLFFGIFFVPAETTIFWSKFERDHDESYVILNGSASIQLGNDVGLFSQGDSINVFADQVHSITTGKKQEAVIGYVQNIAMETQLSSTLYDLKYSRSRRASYISPHDYTVSVLNEKKPCTTPYCDTNKSYPKAKKKESMTMVRACKKFLDFRRCKTTKCSEPCSVEEAATSSTSRTPQPQTIHEEEDEWQER